jgi:hypothetical protein
VITRRKALAQVLGCLVASGIFVFAVEMAHGDSVWVELGSSSTYSWRCS